MTTTGSSEIAHMGHCEIQASDLGAPLTLVGPLIFRLLSLGYLCAEMKTLYPLFHLKVIINSQNENRFDSYMMG